MPLAPRGSPRPGPMRLRIVVGREVRIDEFEVRRSEGDLGARWNNRASPGAMTARSHCPRVGGTRSSYAHLDDEDDRAETRQ